MNSHCSRRQFLKRSAFAAGALALAPGGILRAQAAAKRTAVDEVTLGQTGLKLSRLGMGAGSNSGQIQTALGRDGFTKLIHYAYDQGIRYFDCAESYATFEWMAGAIKAHVDVSVTPDQYVFLESAFLLAAIVLGGMGTIVGVLLGAVILKLLPEKLRFFADYRLMLFGLLLVLMMRFRPEGLVASRRRQLEFHEEDEELAVRVEGDIAEEVQG